jgi:hypothetical protein
MFAGAPDARLVAQDREIALEIENVDVSQDRFRTRVFVDGLIPGMHWCPVAAAAVQWDPAQLHFVDFRTNPYHLSPSFFCEMDNGSRLVFQIITGFATACIPFPACRQPIADIEFRVVSHFQETTLDLLDEYLLPPIPEALHPVVHDQVPEPVFDPTLFDGIVRLRPFVRGDTDGTASLTMQDAIGVLQYLFIGAPLDCPDPADVNDDGRVDISDAVYLLRHLFAGAPAPPPPAGEPGLDPTDDALDCAPLPPPPICGA